MRWAAPILLLASLTACGPEAGDYVVYRVSVSSFEAGASCFGDQGPPPNEAT